MRSRRAQGSGTRSFAVWAHITGLNQGDDLVVDAVLSALRDRVDDPRLCTVSMYPPAALERHGVTSLAIGAVPIGESRRNWSMTERSGVVGRVGRIVARGLSEISSAWSAFSELRGYDTLVIAGSGPLEDDPGCAYRLAKWVVLARLARAKVAVLSVGAGPLEQPMHQRLVRLALRLSHYASVRDHSSARLLERIGWRRPVAVRPDMGWAWTRLPVPVPVGSGTTAPPRRVGINVMSLNDPRYERGISITEPDWDRFDTYIGKLRDTVERLLADGREVVLFSTETQHDVVVRNELVERMRNEGVDHVERLTVQEDVSVDGMLAAVRRCDLVVATRFHAALVALATGRPTIALAYHPKTRDLFESLGVESLCLDAEHFTADELLGLVADAPGIWDARRDGVAAGVERLRSELTEQFDRAVAL